MFIVLQPIRYEMKPQKITGTLQHWLVMTWRKTMSWLFSFMSNLQFYRFQILKFCGLTPPPPPPRGVTRTMMMMKYWNYMCMNDILLKSDLKSRRQNQSVTGRQRVWEQNPPITSNVFVSHAVQKVMSVDCDWWFRSVFFVAKKPLPMTQTCTVVNCLNLHSLLGQFGSLAFQQTESSD